MQLLKIKKNIFISEQKIENDYKNKMIHLNCFIIIFKSGKNSYFLH